MFRGDTIQSGLSCLVKLRGGCESRDRVPLVSCHSEKLGYIFEVSGNPM